MDISNMSSLSKIEAFLNRLEEIEKKATKAPWKSVDFGGVEGDDLETVFYREGHRQEDADFAAESRNALPALIAALREAIEEIKILSLSKYGHEYENKVLSEIATLLTGGAEELSGSPPKEEEEGVNERRT